MADKPGLREAARQLGMSAPALLQAFSEGRATREPDGSVDVDKVRTELAANTDAALSAERKSRNFGGSDRPRGGGATLTEERLRGEQLKNELREIELAKLRGDLLPAAEVLEGWQAAIGRARALLLRIPYAVAPELRRAAPQGDKAIAAILTREIHDALKELSNTKVDDLDDEPESGDRGDAGDGSDVMGAATKPKPKRVGRGRVQAKR